MTNNLLYLFYGINAVLFLANVFGILGVISLGRQMGEQREGYEFLRQQYLRSLYPKDPSEGL